jgi:hypothetical protein
MLASGPAPGSAAMSEPHRQHGLKGAPALTGKPSGRRRLGDALKRFRIPCRARPSQAHQAVRLPQGLLLARPAAARNHQPRPRSTRPSQTPTSSWFGSACSSAPTFKRAARTRPSALPCSTCAASPPTIKTSEIYWGAIAWLFLQLILVVILIFWPGAVTYWLDQGPKVDPSTIEIKIPMPQMPSPFEAAPPKF